MQYEIYKVEELTTRANKPYKKMTLQGEGQQNTEERVTMWSDHPDFAGAVIGAKFDWVMLKEDSGTPIPAHPEKNYVNRSIAMPGVAPQAPQNSSVAEMAIKTHIDKWMGKIAMDLKVIQEKLGVDSQGKDYPYPDSVGVDVEKTGEAQTEGNKGEPVAGEDDIKPEDIPF